MISTVVSLLLVQVLGSAVTVFNDVCPERLELLHPYFRTLCQILPDVDECCATPARSSWTPRRTCP